MRIEAPRTADSHDPKLQKILAAAKEVFLEHGYAAASMDLVARRAKASKTTVYTRFPSKEALFAATIVTECERHGMLFRAEDFDHLPLDEALLRIGGRFLDLVWSPEALRTHRIVMGEAARFPEVARVFYDTGFVQTGEAVARFFVRAKERGLIAVDDPAFTARQFLVTLKGFPDCGISLGLCEPPPAAERDAYLRKVIGEFLRGVAAPPA
ncbi:MAG: TetR/AcrR family transcriptional regulator [Rhodospirillales bacterium]|nr:TetR/AcrR family transcriptional regulator [Rhodospirillales bacterium]